MPSPTLHSHHPSPNPRMALAGQFPVLSGGLNPNHPALARQADIDPSGLVHKRIHFIYSPRLMDMAPKMSWCLLSYFPAKASQGMLISSSPTPAMRNY